MTEPFDKRESDDTAVVSWESESDAAIADVSYEFANGMRLVNQLQFSEIDADRFYNPMDFGSAEIDQDDVSNETRLLFELLDGKVSGVVGSYLRRTEADELLRLRGDHVFDDTKDSLGVYSELTWSFAPRWALSGGVRYQRDEVERDGTSASLPGVELDYSETFSEWLPKLSLSYDVSDEVTLGGLVNKGYNPGGVGLSFTQQEFIQYDSEEVWNYELFARASLLDQRLDLAANLFYSDFDDSQRNVAVSLPGGLVDAFTVNADSAESYGLELSAEYRPDDSWRLFGSGSLLRTEIGDFTSAIADYEGNDFQNAPRHMLTLGVDKRLTPRLKAGTDVRWIGSYYSDDLNEEDFKIGDYSVTNVNASYALTPQVELFSYVSNVFDEDTPTSISLVRGSTALSANVLEPREFGVGVRASF